MKHQKHIFITIVLTLLITFFSQAQSLATFSPKARVFIGYDLYNPFLHVVRKRVDEPKILDRSFIGPLAGFEYRIKKHIWLGVKAGYLNTNETKEDFLTTTISNQTKEAVIGFNFYGKYVFHIRGKFQPYAGAGFGYAYTKITKREVNSNLPVMPIANKGGEFSLVLKAGCMYQFNSRIGLFTEGEYRAMASYWSSGLVFQF